MPLFPESGLFYAAFFNLAFNLVFFSFGMRLFRPDGKMGSVKALITNPNLLATLAMLVFLVMDWHLPALIRQPVSLFGRAVLSAQPLCWWVRVWRLSARAICLQGAP